MIVVASEYDISAENLERYMNAYRSMIKSYVGDPFKIWQTRQQIRNFLRTANFDEWIIDDIIEEWEEGIDIWT